MHICNVKYNHVLRDITYCCNIDTTDAKLLMNSYELCTMPDMQWVYSKLLYKFLWIVYYA